MEALFAVCPSVAHNKDWMFAMCSSQGTLQKIASLSCVTVDTRQRMAPLLCVMTLAHDEGVFQPVFCQSRI